MLKSILIFIVTINLSISSYAYIKDYIPDEHPNERYTVHNNGTVTDNITRLMWQVCGIGHTWSNNNTPDNLLDDVCNGNLVNHNWQQALNDAASNTFVYSDWRLPNIKELRTLVAYNRYNPSINEVIFPNTISYNFYWSSSPSANNPDDADDAWTIYFGGGGGSERGRAGSSSNRVRLVRLGW